MSSKNECGIAPSATILGAAAPSYFLLTLAVWPPVSLTCEPDGAGAAAADLSFFGLRISRLLRVWPLAIGLSFGARKMSALFELE